MVKKRGNKILYYWRSAPFKLFQFYKGVFQLLRKKRPERKQILFIVGCQRSGTTLTGRIFERDLNVRVYGEFSKLSFSKGKRKLRLKPLDQVKAIIERDRVPLIVLKPLVESQNLLALLEAFTDSRALWLFRHYKDVAVSNLDLFGIRNGIKNLRPIVTGEPENWRSEKVSRSTREVVLKYFAENMNPYDAASLFWYVRNSLFFELNLDKNPRVMMCDYNDLTSAPIRTIKGVYQFVSCDFPGERLVREVHSRSVGRGKDLQLSPQIDSLCKELWGKLYAVYRVREQD